MIDFILAGLIYITMMFLAFSILSFFTIGLAYTVVSGLRRFFNMFRQPDLAMGSPAGPFSTAYLGLGKRN